MTEQAINQTLATFGRGRTTLIASHRLASLAKTDRTLVFDRGAVVDDGTHAQLLARDKGIYRTLWEHSNPGRRASERSV